MTLAGTLPGLFSGLSQADAELLAQRLLEVTFEAGTTIFAEGDEGDASYFIDSGDVRIEVDRREVDTESILRFQGPGSTLGEVALLDGLPRSATAVAHTDVTARKITSQALEELAVEHPMAVLGITRALAKDATAKLRRATTQLSDYMFGEAPDPEVDELVRRSAAAQAEFAHWPEDRVDALLGALTEAFLANAQAFAEAAVAETHLGNVADKALKNQVACYNVYQSLVGKIGAGAVRVDDETKVSEIATAAGVIFGLVPMTNPVATAYYKTLIALKARNSLILSFHHAALGVGNQVGELIQEVLRAHAAPEDLLLWIKRRGSRKLTGQFMTHPQVSLILATGGAAMVQAAYSSGTPALGVGPGNAPCWIAPDADLDHAALAVVISKSFDNGVICGAEHNLVVDESVRDAFTKGLEANGAAVLTPDEIGRFVAAAIDPATNRLRGLLVGQAASVIAKAIGIERPYDIKVIVVPASWSGEDSALAGEKMAPVLSLFTVNGDDEAIEFSLKLLSFMGSGHTSIVHTRDPQRIEAWAEAMPTSRILVNSPGSQGVVGVTTGLVPSLTLGCGTFGGNSTTDNVTYTNLQNIKRLAYFRTPDSAVAPDTGDAEHAG